jgi:hypothetical protein
MSRCERAGAADGPKAPASILCMVFSMLRSESDRVVLLGEPGTGSAYRPSGSKTLGRLGADVICVSTLIGGAADHARWPISGRTGQSLYWNALNRGEKSGSHMRRG